MGLTARLHATLALAYYALSPPTPESITSTGSADGTHPYIITTGEIAATIANMDSFTGSDGTHVLFKDALALAAPFLLFRLKRTGFSACRIRKVPEGLLLTVRR